jgi:membrane associated rhomboid family serine protease
MPDKAAESLRNAAATITEGMPVTAQQRESAADALRRHHACGRLAGANLEPAGLLVTVSIALACLIVFITEAAASHGYDVLISEPHNAAALSMPLRLLALDPEAVSSGQWWRVFTAGFVHFDIRHLLNNMIVLLVFGVMAERRYGSARFAFIYASGLLTGFLLQLIVTWNTTTITGGASGAICGVFGALAIVGCRYRSERHALAISSSLLLINVFLGFFLPGVAIMTHLGGAIGGTMAALVVGPSPAWRERKVRVEAAQLEVSEAEWEQHEAGPEP